MPDIPYTYDNLNSLYLSVNKLMQTDLLWYKRGFLLSALYLYLTYAEAQVRVFEENNVPQLNELATSDHPKYSDMQYKIFSSAIATYAYIASCINFGKKLSKSSVFDEWIIEIKEKRHRLSAHPDEKYGKEIIAHKRSSLSSNGEVRFKIIDLENTDKTYSLIVNPRKDFTTLEQYIEDLVKKLTKEWKL
ncbi:hypothetical protein HYT18_02575 [Candidatus Microgenomates bacterium]|nr:hypothetical protein [Candidatus Microgenomates bacterium]